MMKYLYTSLLFLTLFCTAIKAQDTLYIESQTVIEMGDSLIIPKNTVVLFTGSYQISIVGTIKAVGTEEEPIIFTSLYDSLNPGGSSWQGLSFLYTDDNPLSDSSIFAYCTFQHAHSYASCGGATGYGGAIRAWSSSRIRFSNCQFKENYAQVYGGAAYIETSNIIFEDCYFYKNITDSIETTSGGCMAIMNAAPTLNRCKIASSWSSSVGGGILAMNCDSTKIINCEFIDNNGSTGGGMFISNCSYMIFANNLFHYNTGRYFGGAFALKNSSFRIINCNIIKNFGGQGGGVYCSSGVASNAYNCIFSDNEVMENWNGPQIYIAFEESTINFFNCVVENGYDDFGGNGGGVGFHGVWNNIIEDRVEFEPCNNNFIYCLPENSPCINSGSMKVEKDLPELDINFHQRVVGGIVDIGICESDYTVNIVENNLDNISIYPIPAKNTITINCNDNSLIGETVTFYSMEAKAIKSLVIRDKTTNISIDFLESGVYLLSAKGMNKKIIVSR